MSAPFGSVRAIYPDSAGTAEVQVTNPSGGVLGGDGLSMCVSLAPGSRATLLTQGATKAYRGERSLQTSAFGVGEGATLEYLPHHAIPYAGSSFFQKTEFRLDRGASLLAWDAFSAGRVARGERFAFSGLSSMTRIYRDGLPVVVDGMELPGAEAEPGAEPFGGYSYLGSVYVLAPGDLRRLADGVSAALGGLHPERRMLASASAVAEGCVVVRLLAANATALYDALNLVRVRSRRVLDLPSGARDVF
ncbi:urease accessory protein UreD [Rubrobacter indicoceani]|uniref:urease accessory protein UreD n=1 Tax=Rubrobacter indicoceani TaxID=2051957 RepID=UPI000E5BFF81|nr:urease accessory protein UreD [Rubrobacter indicoceani]